MTNNLSTFDELLAASKRIAATSEALKSERAELLKEKSVLDDETARLLAQPVPLADLKAFLMDYVDAKGQEFETKLRAAIDQFVHPPRNAHPVKSVEQRKPLSFAEMEALMLPRGEEGITAFGVPQFIQPDKSFFTDSGYYFFFSDVIKATIAGRFEAIGIDYHDTASTGIGTPREERRQEIARIEKRQREIGTQVAAIDQKLHALRG